MMNDDVEERLAKLTIRGAPRQLRDQILAAVAGELRGSQSVPLLGTSSDVSNTCGRHCLFQAVAHANETCMSTTNTDSRWLRRAAMAVAASLLLGIGLNIWAARASEQRLARIFGPPPISQQAMEIAKDVEKITDAQTGQWVYRQLATPRKPGDAAMAYAKYRNTIKRLIDELQTVSKDSCHETLQKDFEMDRGHTGCLGGRRFDCQRRIRLDYRCTA
jgi:hypothetical protein